MDREEALHAARGALEAPSWVLFGELEKTLAGLAATPHFELTDATAVGSALHSALPRAVSDAGLSEAGLTVASYHVGPSNKLVGEVTIDGRSRHVSLELHLAGPQGGTRKGKHQFAEMDVECAPCLPGLELEAPPDLLFFLSYQLSATGTSIQKAYLAFADGVDRKKIELHRDASVTSSAEESDHGGFDDKAVGSKVKIRKHKTEEAPHDDGEANQRGDGASRA